MRLSLAVLVTVVVAACKGGEAPPPEPTQPKQPTEARPAPKPTPVTLNPIASALFPALAAEATNPDNAATPEKVGLGRLLFWEKRLSKNHDVSCNSCHGLGTAGVDGKVTSPGHKGQLGARNSPTVLNAAFHSTQFWDSRAANVEEQAKGPILNPVEMAMKDEKAVLAVLKSIPEYIAAFKKAFPADKDPVTYDNLAKAIGAFERKLVAPGKWDRFLGGDQAALSDAEKKGANTFIEAGCMACHMGATFGGTMNQKLGLLSPWPKRDGEKEDLGRFEVTKNETDKLMFKVPGLRNVTRTAPYLHNGLYPDLKEVVKLMGKYQSGKDLTDAQVGEIVTFLGALEGDPPAELLAEPKLPESTAKTPKPDPT